MLPAHWTVALQHEKTRVQLSRFCRGNLPDVPCSRCKALPPPFRPLIVPPRVATDQTAGQGPFLRGPAGGQGRGEETTRRAAAAAIPASTKLSPAAWCRCDCRSSTRAGQKLAISVNLSPCLLRRQLPLRTRGAHVGQPTPHLPASRPCGRAQDVADTADSLPTCVITQQPAAERESEWSIPHLRFKHICF